MSNIIELPSLDTETLVFQERVEDGGYRLVELRPDGSTYEICQSQSSLNLEIIGDFWGAHYLSFGKFFGDEEHIHPVVFIRRIDDAFHVIALNRPGFAGGSNSQVGWSHDQSDHQQVLP